MEPIGMKRRPLLDLNLKGKPQTVPPFAMKPKGMNTGALLAMNSKLARNLKARADLYRYLL
jgi:hypothetical protein